MINFCGKVILWVKRFLVLRRMFLQPVETPFMDGALRDLVWSLAKYCGLEIARKIAIAEKLTIFLYLTLFLRS